VEERLWLWNLFRERSHFWKQTEVAIVGWWGRTKASSAQFNLFTWARLHICIQKEDTST
jgi:hypothetical protein